MAEGKAQVTAGAGLNVRRGAGTGYAKIGALSCGATVSYSCETNGWLQIRHNGQTGYICKQYTRITQAASGGGSGAGAGGRAHVTAREGLNVRTGPGTGYGKLGALAYNATVSYSGEQGGWLQITYNGRTGWICKQYTAVSGGGGSSGGSSSGGGVGASSGTVKVTAGVGLNVRTGPGTGYGRIGGLSCGQVVSYSSEQGGWLKISYAGKAGWICKQYTTPVSGGGSSSGGSSSGGTSTMYVTATAGLNLRSGPGTGYARVGGLSYGAAVTVIGSKSNWKQVRYSGGTAWACGDYLSGNKPGGASGGGGGGWTPSGTNPADFATNYLYSKTGLYTRDFIYKSPKLPTLTDLAPYGYNNGYDCNCANFVSACSRSCGWLSTHYLGVVAMYNALRNGSVCGYREIARSRARKGDIWCNRSLGHTELVYSNSGGTITLIGSNNAGTRFQRVTFDSSSGYDGHFLSRQ